MGQGGVRGGVRVSVTKGAVGNSQNVNENVSSKRVK